MADLHDHVDGRDRDDVRPLWRGVAGTIVIPQTIRVRYLSKLGLPNYSGVEAEIEITYALDEGDDLREATTAAFADAKSAVLENVRVARSHVLNEQAALGDGAYEKRAPNTRVRD